MDSQWNGKVLKSWQLKDGTLFRLIDRGEDVPLVRFCAVFFVFGGNKIRECVGRHETSKLKAFREAKHEYLKQTNPKYAATVKKIKSPTREALTEERLLKIREMLDKQSMVIPKGEWLISEASLEALEKISGHKP